MGIKVVITAHDTSEGIRIYYRVYSADKQEADKVMQLLGFANIAEYAWTQTEGHQCYASKLKFPYGAYAFDFKAEINVNEGTNYV